MDTPVLDYARNRSRPFDASLFLQQPSLLKRAILLFSKLLLAFFVLSISLVVLFDFVPVPLTPLMIMRSGENLLKNKPIHLEKGWVPLERISSQLQYAVIAAEDQRFFEHYGFDFEAIDKAYRHNLRSRHIRGASTISQQVAKNMFLLPTRSYARKFVEAYFTALIEAIWSKERILEVYLNIIELGDGVYGVEAASRRFFHKPATKISYSEAALMAAVLPNPRRFFNYTAF